MDPEEQNGVWREARPVEWAFDALIHWARAVALQIDRLTPTWSEPVNSRNVIPDAQLCIVAIRNVMRAADMLEAIPWPDKKFAEDLRIRIAAFRERVGAVKSVRDVLDHFDDYGTGRGRLENFRNYSVRSNYDGKGHHELIVGPETIDLTKCADAVDKLLAVIPLLLRNAEQLQG